MVEDGCWLVPELFRDVNRHAISANIDSRRAVVGIAVIDRGSRKEQPGLFCRLREFKESVGGILLVRGAVRGGTQ